MQIQRLMMALLTLTLTLTMLSTVAFADKKPLKLTDANFDSKVIKSDKPALIFFKADWAGPCRMALPMVEKLAAKYAGKINVGVLDVDQSGETAARFGVRSVPTFIALKAGEEVGRHVGVADKGKLEGLIGL